MGRYVGITSGKIIEGFSFIPNVNLNWMTLNGCRYYDVQFSWLRWHFVVGQIHKKLKECGYQHFLIKKVWYFQKKVVTLQSYQKILTIK